MNIKRLKDKMAEKGYNILTFSEALGVDRSTFYRKTHPNSVGFSIKEVRAMANTLELSKDEVNNIFFD